MQMDLEDYFWQIATIQKKSVIILTDRGVMDNTAYCAAEVEQKIYEETGWNKTDIRDNRYDMVIHLVTAADGASEFYTLENNAARTETPDVAKMLDKMTQGVWNGHPNYV
jgi:nicotinamide riboside kinase